jgi:hypothetical protein
MPGKHVNVVKLNLPKDVKKSKYKLEMGISDKQISQIYFATNATVDGAYYVVGEVSVL